MDSEDLKKEIEDLKKQNEILVQQVYDFKHDWENTTTDVWILFLVILLVLAVGYMFFKFLGYQSTLDSLLQTVDALQSALSGYSSAY